MFIVLIYLLPSFLLSTIPSISPKTLETDISPDSFILQEMHYSYYFCYYFGNEIKGFYTAFQTHFSFLYFHFSYIFPFPLI